MKPKIIVVIGARPQFIKHFPFEKASLDKLDLIAIHTGQHYDKNMSDIFFEQLKMSKPEYTLNIGSGNHGVQTGKMMIEIEGIVEKESPNGMVVYGDTNSTLAGALVASKLHLPLFHIESGLRSYNKTMPEEINRVLTDHISNLLFIPSNVARQNLLQEGIKDGVHDVGDIMKDLIKIVLDENILSDGNKLGNYYYITIHRPYNTDSKNRLINILEELNKLNLKAIMTLHPRTKNLADKYEINLKSFDNIQFIEPQSYFDNLNYLFNSRGLITDSGGMQKEAYWLKKKCVTIRTETEWTETLGGDANKLVFNDLSMIHKEMDLVPFNWDDTLYGSGKTANKIVDLISNYYKL